MAVLWVIIGVVAILVVWAIVSAVSGRKDVEVPAEAPPPAPVYESPEPDVRKAHSWEDGPTTTVGKHFGKGGKPSGVSRDSGGIATAEMDDDFERLKKARAFEPRGTKLDLDSGPEEEAEPAEA